MAHNFDIVYNDLNIEVIMRFYTPSNSLIMPFIVAVLGWACTALVNIYLANHNPPAIYGDLYLAITTLTSASIILCLGRLSMIPKLVQSFSKGRAYDHKEGIAWLLRTVIYTSSVLCIGCAGIVILTHYVTLPKALGFHILYYTLLCSPIFSYFQIYSTLSGASGQHLLSQSLQYVLFPLILLASYFSLNLMHIPKQHEVLLLIFTTSIFCLCISMFLFYWHQPDLRNIALYGKSSPLVTQWNQESFGYLKKTLKLQLVYFGPVYLLEYFSVNENDVAIYGVINTIQALLQTVKCVIYYGSFKNQAARLYANQKHALQILIRKTNAFVLCVFLVTNLVILYFNQPILGLFGAQYQKNTWILAAYLLLQCLDLSNNASIALCQLSKEGIASVNRILNFSVLCICFCAPAAHWYGLWGLVSVQALSTVVFSSYLTTRMKHITGLNMLF